MVTAAFQVRLHTFTRDLNDDVINFQPSQSNLCASPSRDEQRRDQTVSKPVMQWAARHMAVGRGREEGAFDNLPWEAWTGDGKR